MKHKLTDKYVQNLKPNPQRRIEVRDEVLIGFALRVSARGRKTFYYSRRINGRVRPIRLGDYGVLSLSEARDQAREIAYQIETGSFERSGEVCNEACPSLGQIIPDYIEKHAKVHNKDWSRKAAHLKKFSSLYGKPLDQIKRRDVVTVVDEIATRTPVGANRALAHFRHLMNWSVDRGLIDASPVTRIKAPAKERARERVLSDHELADLWRACDVEGYPFGDCIKLLILTGQRRAEVAEMRWSEIDLERRVWALPSARSKNGQQHEIPLTDVMIDLLQSAPRFVQSDYVFTTNGRSPISGFGRFKQRLDKTLTAFTQPWIFHDLRRTFSTNLAMLGVPQPVTEALLNHQSGVVSGVAAIYNRYQYAEEKRVALEGWCQHLLR